MKNFLLSLLLATGLLAQTIQPSTLLINGQVTPAAPSGGAATFSSITDTGLTAGQIVYTGTGGLLSSNDQLKYDGTTGVALGSTLTSGLQLYNTPSQSIYTRLVNRWISDIAYIGVEVEDVSGIERSLRLGVGTSGGDGTIAGGRFMQIAPSVPFLSFSASTSSAGNIVSLAQITSAATSGNVVPFAIAPTYNQASGNAANTDLKIARVETALGSGVQAFIDLYAGAAGTTQKYTILNTGKVSNYAGVATAGWGVPAIYAAGAPGSTVNTGVASIATYTVGAADGDFEVSASCLVTVATAHTFSLDVTYTDTSNVARTMVLPINALAGTFLTSGLITNITGAGPYESAVMHISAKASTAITIRTSAGGTFTTVTYFPRAIIRQLN